MAMLQPKVKARKGPREGRGFSLAELREAGLVAAQARKLGARVDERRRSLHAPNVQALRELQKAPAPEAAAPPEKAEAAAASIPLTEIKGIGEKRAERLAAAGIKGAGDLATADLETVAKRAKIPLKTLQKYQEEAKKLVGG